MTEPSFEIPQRQSLLGVVVYLVKNGRAMVSAAFVLWFASDSAPVERGLIFGGIGLILALILVISYLQYRNFTFHIEKNELIVNSGIIFKEQRIIPFDRIQSVHTHQNIIQQLLNLTGLKVDSAGSKGKELEIPALDRQTADALQRYLEEQRESEQPADQPAGVETGTPEATSRKELLRLGIPDLVKIGITENHLKTGLLAVAFVYGYYSQYSSYLENYVDTDVETYLPEAMRLGLILAIGGAVFFFLLSVVLSLIMAFLKYFDFHAWVDRTVIGINSGLLRRNQYRIPVRKVQYLIWNSNPLRRLLRFETVVVKQAQSSEMKKKETISIPACRTTHTAALENLLFQRTFDSNTDGLKSDLWAHLRLASLLITVPIIVSMGIIYLVNSSIFLPSLLAYPVVWFFSYKYARSVRVAVFEDQIVVKKGWVFPSRIVFPCYKAQSVQLTQSIFMRPRGLAHLKIFTAAGSITVPFLSEPAARKVFDYCMYKVEASTGSWM